jgi:2-polyprenyl-6-methoxyphenol hydroxylase-like FAD-dependent oxidoreductase
MRTSKTLENGGVLVVGAGPVGLTMAGELARHGIRPRIIDRLKEPLAYCRAIGVTPRTLEVWDDMGVARDMIDAGIWIDTVRSIFNGQVTDLTDDLSDLPYARLGLPQNHTERLLTRHLAGFGIEIERGISLDGLAQEGGQVHAVLVDGSRKREEARFRYVVGCDGAHSAVRRALGIAFEGARSPWSSCWATCTSTGRCRLPSCFDSSRRPRAVRRVFSSRYRCRKRGAIAFPPPHRRVLRAQARGPGMGSNRRCRFRGSSTFRPPPPSSCPKKRS